MIVNVRQGLNSFLKDRKERFLNVTGRQKEEWIKGIEENTSPKQWTTMMSILTMCLKA